ncbi:MAG: thioredoxin family protein [Paracoccaceae bacterium]
MNRRAVLILSSVLPLLPLAGLPAHAEPAALTLVMFEQPGCTYCAAWNANVGPEYPLTDEGRAAPLHRVQLRDGIPEGMQMTSVPVFTPTFVLMGDGQELGRIEGYPGEDFFWGMLGAMLRDAGADLRR